MYWAVQSPMPGSALSWSMVCSARAGVFRSSWPLSTACASAMMAAWRWRTMPSTPSASGEACANTAGVGNRRVSCGQGAAGDAESDVAGDAESDAESDAEGDIANGSPKACAIRFVNVQAAATVTCWPTMARTATSNPSTQPGTRMPSVPAKCAPSTALMAAGSASRSSAARMRAITVGSTQRKLSLTSSCTTQRASSKCHCSQPDTF